MGDKLIIKQINKKYDTERALENVLRYIIRKKSNEEEGEVVYWKALGASGKSIGSAIRQFIKIQEMAGKANKKRIRHFMVSLPRCADKLKEAVTVADVTAKYIFRDYQVIYAVHEKEKMFHIHFAVNPVSYRTHKKWHMSRHEFEEWKTDVLEIVNKSRTDYGYSIFEL